MVTLPAGASRTYTAAELQTGASAGLRGSLGEGAGEWRLTLDSDQPVQVMSLLSSPAGHLSNLSTAPVPVAESAPPVFATDTETPGAETAEDVFREDVSPIVQAKCLICHVAGGVSGEGVSRLQFVSSTVEGHVALNLAVFEALIAILGEDEQVEDPVAYILNKVQGVGHGGGSQATAGTDDYASLDRFLGLLGDAAAPVAITPETLFEGVTMESARSTLRRAALVFAGRVPTQAEYAAIVPASDEGDATERALRSAIRGLMTGPEFHEFLIRASNDRLFTDREGTIIDAAATNDFVDFSNLYYEKSLTVSRNERWRWYQEVQHGIRRAPLELIAHVAEKDLPYTEVLTADYIMANPHAAEAYGAATAFDDPSNVHEFEPSQIVSYYRDGPNKVSEYSLELGTKVINSGDLATDYPHAGILNTTAFLLRYPTTATNRNRARSRWTYYHFLGLDIEKSASRTTDPVALADTNNPTMHNPACTVCHSVMDPVAGAFQNYGDEGLYRDQWEGLDSLDSFYKAGDTYPSVTAQVAADSTRTTPDLVTASGWLAAGAREIGLRTVNSIGHTNIHVDYLTIRDDSGTLVQRIELEGFGNGDRNWDGASFEICCEVLIVPINVRSNGTYEFEVGAWLGYQSDEAEGRPGTLSVSIGGPFYRNGDSWYRDMRTPGFNGELAPDPRNSLQWLAQKIVADERFAQAAVEFWWPAIMGAEVAEPPEDESDADFEGLLLASNAQAAEVTRLADGFRSGFHEGSPYNLKDLFVEIVLSKWFRAESVSADDQVRAIGLGGVGARRLLTPEELAHKTLVLTGFQWGRYRGQNWRAPQERHLSLLADQEWGYGLLYGGIDSDGVTERARDLTSVMAGVAQSHALQSSYPIVMREFFLLPDEDRRLFRGVDHTVSPVSELGGTFEIEAPSRTEKETVSLMGSLNAGSKNVRLTYINDFFDSELGDRNIHADRLRVLTASGSVVGTWEIEDAGRVREYCEPRSDRFWLAVNCSVNISIDVPSDGEYTVEVVVWADHAGDELPRLQVTVESTDLSSSATNSLRDKLVELFDKLHGIHVTADSPEVQDAYELFVEVWERKRGTSSDHFRWNEENIEIHWASDHHFLDGIADDLWRQELDENGNELGWDWDGIGDFFGEIDWGDPHAVARTWTVVLAYLMMDYRYLYL